MAALEPTPSQTVGPFFAFGLTTRVMNALVPTEEPGAIELVGRVVDGAGDGVSDAMVEIWQPDAEGSYRDGFGWGRAGTDAEGRYSFRTVKPGAVAGQAPHLDVLVFARGLLKPVLTRVYFPDETEANAADPVLSALPDDAARATLIAGAQDGGLRFDIHLQGEGQTTFFAL